MESSRIHPTWTTCPQEELLDEKTGTAFFALQTYCGVAEDENSHVIYGLYILHPNNVGRCGHICNAGYAVSAESRRKYVGEKQGGQIIATGTPAEIKQNEQSITGRYL